MCALVMTFDQKNSLFSSLPYNKTSCLHLLFKEAKNVVFIPDFQLKLHMETPPPHTFILCTVESSLFMGDECLLSSCVTLTYAFTSPGTLTE